MAEKLTPQQEQAVKNRGGKLLVSAAAGSGKTKVLVDRLMSYLTDPNDPANMDEFLIITYTKAAASELRGKIAAKLSEHISQQPENRHLQQQLQRLYMTQISTVHAFCGELLRQYAYRLDLSADIRVADESECGQLREEVMARLLEEAYAGAQEDEELSCFLDTQSTGRNDRTVPEVLLKVYDSSRCHLDPDGWLQGCVDAVETEDISDVSQTRWGRYLMDELFAYLDLQIDAMGRCAQMAGIDPEAQKPAALLGDIRQQLISLRDSETWDEVVRRKHIDYGTLRFSKKCADMEMQEQIKAVRDACKSGVGKMLRNFTDPSEQVLKDLRSSAKAVRGMVKLTKEFAKAFEKAKNRRRIMDFADLEHRTLDLLLGSGRTGVTSVAREIGSRFREVMVDEYQDSNEVQDAIYAALTDKRQNCFMVGDVKQSIYQFRLADPGIFLEKYAAYTPADQAKPGQGRKVLLTRNFRSGGAVLSAVNCVFEACMSPRVGGLVYGEDESLYEGIPHEPLGEPEVELYAVSVRESAYAEEAAFVTQRIRELLDGTHYVRGKDGLRPICPEDICILLRSPGSGGEEFRVALESAGIRCAFGGGGDLLQTQEITVLRSLLQTIHNPQLDIPLVATLASPLFGFTADDLAAFRSDDRYCSVYDALKKSHLPKACRFVQCLQNLRREAQTVGLISLLESVFTTTRIDGIYGAMANGEVRSANLRAFYQLAVDFCSGGARDLGRFLEYLSSIEGKGLVGAAESSNAGCVTIMSIHKSKGLEFPVVFLCNLARRFNRDSQSAQVLCHKELGVGIPAADTKRRVRYPTVAKRALAAKIGADSLSEELRVLYVAMTRARDRLIMTYTAKNLAGELQAAVARLNMDQKELLTQEASSPGKWVLLAALTRLEAGELFALGGATNQRTGSDYPWKICVVEAPETVVGQSAEQERGELPEGSVQYLRDSLSYRYPYPEATAAPSKQTATQRKGRVKDQEAAENTPEPKAVYRQWRTPSFVEQSFRGTDYGNAFHRVMQYIRYENCVDLTGVKKELSRLVSEGLLAQEQAEAIEPEKILCFFQTRLGKRLMGSERVLREFKFSILDDGTSYDSKLTGEKILLQGVVDLAILEPDGIILLDFKTDRVTEETVDQAAQGYRLQVEAYAQALSRIYALPIKEKLLYFFRLNRFVSLS